MSEPEELGPSLLERPVVIVGNGASLLGRGNGAWIDGHEIVVRFNLFQTGRFAADVGTKTTVWFNNRDATSATIRKMLAEHEFERIHVHTWDDVARAAATFKEELTRLGRATPVIPVDRGVLAAMRDFLGGGYTMFSTGAIGTWIMLQQFRRVTLVGFDWWDAPARFHYSDADVFAHDEKKGHQPAIERRFFAHLQEQGRLNFHEAGCSEESESREPTGAWFCALRKSSKHPERSASG